MSKQEQDALALEYPSMTIQNREFEFRPLGWNDMSRFMDIVKKAAHAYQRNSQIYGAIAEGDRERMVSEFISIGPVVAEELFDWVAGLLVEQKGNKRVPLSAEEFRDPYFNNIRTMPKIYHNLSEHPDLAAFLEEWATILKDGTATQNFKEMFGVFQSAFSPTSETSSGN